MEYPFSANIRATANASPPLFPGPAKTTMGDVVVQLFMMARLNACAARSIKSMLLMDSCAMV